MKNFATKTLLLSLMTITSPYAAADKWDEHIKDAWLDGKAETTILLNNNLSALDINTDVNQQVVTLTGSVDSEVEKALAEELILGLEDVKSVDNKLTVIGKTTHQSTKTYSELKDTKITTVVKTKLLLDKHVDGSAIGVSTESGVVTLSGQLDSDAERDLAIEITQNTEDVEDVIAELTINH